MSDTLDATHLIWVRDGQDRVVLEVFKSGAIHVTPEATREHVYWALCESVRQLVDNKRTPFVAQRPSSGESNG